MITSMPVDELGELTYLSHVVCGPDDHLLMSGVDMFVLHRFLPKAYTHVS